SFHPDTARGVLHKRKHEDSKTTASREIAPHSVIVFPKERCDRDPLPFGVGLVKAVRSPKNSGWVTPLSTREALFFQLGPTRETESFTSKNTPSRRHTHRTRMKPTRL